MRGGGRLVTGFVLWTGTVGYTGTTVVVLPSCLVSMKKGEMKEGESMRKQMADGKAEGDRK